MDITNRIKITNHFYLDEFFDKQTYINNTETELRSRLDMEFISDLENLRINIGMPFTINNWWIGGNKQWRGFRNPKCKEYSKGSMHTYIIGVKLRAVDFVCRVGSEYIRHHIKDNYHLYPTFKRLERGVSWNHIDTKETNIKGIEEFSK